MQGLEFAYRFSERIARFLQKMRDLSDSLMVAHFWRASWANRSWSLIFGETEQLAHIAHFWWATWAIRSNSSLKKREWAICQKVLSLSLICSFIMSNLSELLTAAHLSWATWAICSRLLFWYERPERFAHSHPFVLSDLSDSLTVAHLIWAKWANEQMS